MSSQYPEEYLDSSGAAARSKYAGVEDPEARDETGWGSSLTGHDATPTINMGKPRWGSASLAKPYYYNGPSTNPYDMHSAEYQRLAAGQETWSQPERRAVLDTYSALLMRYGHSNSPGTLLALAQSGLDTDSPAIQQMLGIDAAAYHDDYAQSMPQPADAAMQESDESILDTLWPNDFWKIPQFASRNFLSALSMPLEAVQGSWRGVGGALTEEGGPDIGAAVASVASLIPPVAAIIDGSIMADDQFVNPWEQTDFGQTLLYGATNDWSDAFSSAQAGLDFEAANELVMNDDRFAGERQAILADPAQRDAVLEGVARKEQLFGDPGWFIDETSPIGEAQRQATFRSWAIPGPDGEMTSWTMGRGIVGMTSGTDWAGYGVTSGLIDAIASVSMDPTIIGAKFGVVSKTARGIGKGAEALAPSKLAGAERFLTFGQERVKELKKVGVTHKSAQKLVDDYNRLTTVEGTPLYKHDPISLEEWGSYDPEQHVAAVRLMKEAKATEDALNAAEPGASSLWSKVKEQRRATSRWMRGTSRIEQAHEDIPALGRTRELWQEYDKAARMEKPSKNGGVVYSKDREAAWVESLDDADKALWAESQNLMKELDESGRLGLKARGGARVKELIDNAVGYYDTQIKKGAGAVPTYQNAEKASADAVRMVLANQMDEPMQSLGSIDTTGTTIAGEFIPGAPHVSVTDKIPTLTYWVGEEPPKIKPGSSYLAETEGLNDRLADYILDLGKDLATKKPTVKKAEQGTLVDSISRRIRDIENPFPTLADDIRNPGLTLGQTYIKLAEHGLDGYLDDFLRSEGIDGISGVNKTTRDGVWFGDHPLLESYMIPDSTVDDAVRAGGMVDGMDEFLNGLGAAQPAGVRTLTRTQAEMFALRADRANLKAAEASKKLHGDSLEKARAEQLNLEQTMVTLDELFSEPQKALKAIMQHEAGVAVNPSRGATVAPDAMRWFLFGNGPMGIFRARAMKVMANLVSDTDRAKFKGLTPDSKEWWAVYDEIGVKYMGQLVAMTKNKWSADTMQAVLRNAINGGGEDGLYKALAPRLGVDVFGDTVTASVKKSMKDGLNEVETFRTSNSAVKRYTARMMAERPGQREIDLDNARDVVDAIIKYGMYAKLDPRDIQRLTGKIMLHDGRFDAVPTNVDVIKETFNLIGKRLVKNVEDSTTLFAGEGGDIRKTEITRALTESTRVFLGGHVWKPDTVDRLGHQTDLAKFIDGAGNSVEMPRILLESELITGKLSLPNVDEWAAGINRLSRALVRLPSTEHAYKLARSIYDDFFRTSLLVFRGAYILRNSAEMQVRLFLNGHHSVFSDPVSLLGMVMGGRTNSKFAKSFSPYSNTILDTAFEVGVDEEAAFANHVQEFFALTRQANSLTDPRVYRSTIHRGWLPVDVDKPQFAQGWANELTMLNRSALSRAVLGEMPADFKAAPGVPREQHVVNWLLSDAKSAQKVRAELIAGDDKYAAIFGSHKMTMDYVWENENSVFNRLSRFTMNDPVLEDFVRSGKWHGPELTKAVGRMPRLEQRILALETALKKRFWDGGDVEAAMKSHMRGESGNGGMVTVPWADAGKMRGASSFIDDFFRFANKFERLGTVGPEFKMAYWDRVAELAPGLRASDIDTALKGAESTLRPLKRMNPDGKLANVGRNHPAWEALNKAKAENSDGLMNLQDIHSIAMDHAAEHVKELFYDAARRNNFWSATRLVFPFGQAWGNTISVWGQLGAKRPIQVYKALKVMNALVEPGSSSVYDAGEGWMFGDYKEGMAPWEQDPNGGFFYQNQFGETSFMTPFVGRAAALPLNFMTKVQGFDSNVNSIDMQSGTQSLNMALGSDQLLPGMSFVVPMVLDKMPESEMVAQMKAIVSPFGEKDALGQAVPAWLQNTIGGLAAVPVIGDVVSDFLSPFAPAMKNKNARDAIAILSASGDYDMTDPQSVQRLQDDAADLGSSLLLVTGIFKNWMPTSPTPQLGVSGEDTGKGTRLGDTPNTLALAAFGKMYPMYLQENGGDETLAKEQMVRDYGPAALFALTRNKRGYTSQPSSQARKWAMQSEDNMNVARANPDYFGLFFPKGDYTDVTTKLWMDELTSRESQYKTPKEILDDNISYMQRIRRGRIDFFEGNKLITKEEAEAMRDDVKEEFANTSAGTAFNSQTATDRVGQIDNMYRTTPSLRQTNAGQAWNLAMGLREQALSEIRSRTGQDNSTLSGKRAAPILAAYKKDLDDLLSAYPDFTLLHNTLSREWD